MPADEIFHVGEAVWVKYFHWPTWPARIVEIRKNFTRYRRAQPPSYVVEFFGHLNEDDKRGEIGPTCVFKHNRANLDRYGHPHRRTLDRMEAHYQRDFYTALDILQEMPFTDELFPNPYDQEFHLELPGDSNLISNGTVLENGDVHDRSTLHTPTPCDSLSDTGSSISGSTPITSMSSRNQNNNQNGTPVSQISNSSTTPSKSVHSFNTIRPPSAQQNSSPSSTPGTSNGTTVGTPNGTIASTTAGISAGTSASTSIGTTAGTSTGISAGTSAGTTVGTTVGTSAGASTQQQKQQRPPQQPQQLKQQQQRQETVEEMIKKLRTALHAKIYTKLTTKLNEAIKNCPGSPDIMKALDGIDATTKSTREKINAINELLDKIKEFV